MADKGILLTKSPYYITEAGSAGFTSNLELRIWSGSSASVPATANYTISKQALNTAVSSSTMEIGKIVESSFDHLPGMYKLASIAKTEPLWVNVQSTGGSVNRNDIWLALDGYGEFLDGINYNPTESTLISERILYHHSGIDLNLPVYVQGNSYANTVDFRKNGSVVQTFDYTSLISSTNSYDRIQYINYTGSAGTVDEIYVKNNAGTTLETIRVEISPCTKYTPYVISFINKWGVNQELIFTLASKKRVAIQKKSFKRQLLDLSSGTPTYNIGKHGTKDYNVSAQESIILTTNYIDESLNDTIVELLQSEYVWLTANGVTAPVNVNTSTLEYKTSAVDGLINYQIGFDYANNLRNSIY